MDILSELVGHLALRCRPPIVHTFCARWAVEVPPGPPALHLVRRGTCALWAHSARHSMQLGEGSLVLASGAAPYTLQVRGPRVEASGHFDWAAGQPLGRARTPPETPDAVQFISAKLELAQRPGPIHHLPELVLVGAQQIPLPRSYRPVFDGLLEELTMPRIGGHEIIQRLLEVMVIQALRIHVITGFGSADGWLGVLSDPVLRTCLDDQEQLTTRDPARSLASTSQRAVRRLSARLRSAAATPPRALAQQLRIQRVFQLIEEGVHPLARIAQQTGFSSVSSLCRAFRREVGTTPAAYWRRVQRRRLPRKGPTGE